MTALLGRPMMLYLTSSNVSDVTAADELLKHRPSGKIVIADKAYDVGRLCSTVRARKGRPVIPGGGSRKKRIRYDNVRYRQR